MRPLVAEASDTLDGQIEILAGERESAGGAPLYYEIRPTQHPSRFATMAIRFCSSSPPDGGTNEALLLILGDRLAKFQAGPQPCEENAHALARVKAALASLRCRADRIRRERQFVLVDDPQRPKEQQPLLDKMAEILNGGNKPAQPEGGTMEPFKLGDRVSVVAMGIAGQITCVNERLGGCKQYLVRYLDRQGCIREDWCTDVELART